MKDDLKQVREMGLRIRGAVSQWYARRTGAVCPKTLEGGCAVASYTLYRAMRRAGYDAVLVRGESLVGDSHCWVEWMDYVIDITATQFYSYPPWNRASTLSPSSHSKAGSNGDTHGLQRCIQGSVRRG